MSLVPKTHGPVSEILRPTVFLIQNVFFFEKPHSAHTACCVMFPGRPGHPVNKHSDNEAAGGLAKHRNSPHVNLPPNKLVPSVPAAGILGLSEGFDALIFQRKRAVWLQSVP